MGTEHISRTRALRLSSHFRLGLLFRRGWGMLVTASVFGCALYLLFTAAPLTFAAQATAQYPVQTQHAELSAVMAPAMDSASPPSHSAAREQRLSTVSSDDLGQPAPPPISTAKEPAATPPTVPTRIPTEQTEQTGQAEQAEQTEQIEQAGQKGQEGQSPEAERGMDPTLPARPTPLETTDNTQTVDEATTAATGVLGAAGTTSTPAPPSAATAAPSPTSPAKAAPPKETRRLFGTVEMRASIRDLRQWQDVQKRHADNPIFTPGFKLNASTTWDKLKSMLDGKSTLEKIRGVNSFWNQWPYKLDIAGYGKEDYWAAPYEFRKNSGDCEDYAIVKYYTLKELGIPVEQMRIVVLKDTILNVAHAILAVYLEDDIYILDNIAKNVLSHTRIRNYLPVYSVNEQFRWVHVRTK